VRIFILEDDQIRIGAFLAAIPPNHEVTVATQLSGPNGAYKKFKPPYGLILLDHDLGGRQFVSSDEEETGFQFCRWLGTAPVDCDTSVVIHSYNQDGAKAMSRLLMDNGWIVVVIPFGVPLLNALKETK
jgi:NAD+-processing family protein with receiver domain